MVMVMVAAMEAAAACDTAAASRYNFGARWVSMLCLRNPTVSIKMPPAMAPVRLCATICSNSLGLLKTRLS